MLLLPLSCITVEMRYITKKSNRYLNHLGKDTLILPVNILLIKRKNTDKTIITDVIIDSLASPESEYSEKGLITPRAKEADKSIINPYVKKSPTFVCIFGPCL